MKESYTHITLVVDRSGSMESIKADAQGGINTFVRDQKEVKGEATFYLADFDTEHQDVFGPADIQGFSHYALKPRGGTALYDAIGKAIVTTGEFLDKMDEADKPGRVVLCIVTDGGENSSREFTGDQVRALVTEHQDKYNWQVVFIGANINAYATGTSLGFRGQHTTQYHATPQSATAMFSNVNSTVKAYRGAAAGSMMGAVASTDAGGNNTANPGTGKVWDDDTKSWVDPDTVVNTR